MTNVFTNVGEFRRGKGNRKTRLGPRINVGGEARRGGERQTQTPDDIAIKKLIKLLDKPGLSQRDRYAYADIMRHAEQIRFMNMPVLAEVLLFIHDKGNTITADNFNYNATLPYVNRLLPQREVMEGGIRTKEVPEEDLVIMRLRMVATFLRYIRYVSLLREEAAQQLEEARIQQAETTFPIIDEM
jgi:hypothetical protein